MPKHIPMPTVVYEILLAKLAIRILRKEIRDWMWHIILRGESFDKYFDRPLFERIMDLTQRNQFIIKKMK